MSNIRREYEFDIKTFMADIRRAAPGKSLRDLAILIGVSASALSRWDHGELMDIESFMSACAAFELTPGDYFKPVIWRREG